MVKGKQPRVFANNHFPILSKTHRGIIVRRSKWRWNKHLGVTLPKFLNLITFKSHLPQVRNIPKNPYHQRKPASGLFLIQSEWSNSKSKSTAVSINTNSDQHTTNLKAQFGSSSLKPKSCDLLNMADQGVVQIHKWIAGFEFNSDRNNTQ